MRDPDDHEHTDDDHDHEPEEDTAARDALADDWDDLCRRERAFSRDHYD